MSQRARRRQALSLLELMVVIGIVGLLALAAVPSLREARVRGKVAAAKSQTRNLASALEAYAIDWNAYPPAEASFPDDPLGLIAETQLQALQSPAAYAQEAAFRDPFGVVSPPSTSSAIVDESDPLRAALQLSPPNLQRSLLYYHYPTLFERIQAPCPPIKGAAVVSLGPDAMDSLGAYRPIEARWFQQIFSQERGFPGPDDKKHPINGIYDPTNGTLSAGDIAAFAGAASRFAHP